MSDNQYQQNRNSPERISPGKWIEPGKIVKLAGFEIKGGNFYYGGEELKGRDNTWRQSITTDPEKGRGFVQWLASNRGDPDCYIGYVFLYFYGIERRLLMDGKQLFRFDRRALYNEIWRLKRIYAGNSTFNRDATSLLAHIWVLLHHDRFWPLEKRPDESLLIGTREFTSVFKYLLGETVDQGAPVSSELALAWVKSHPDFNIKILNERDQNDFDSLFKLRYMGRYRQGITIRPDNTKLQLVYHPASPTLFGCHRIKLDFYDPRPERLIRPAKTLMTLAESCTYELETRNKKTEISTRGSAAQIKTNKKPSTRKNRKSVEWIQPGQTIKIEKYEIEIKGGYFYYGDRAKLTDNDRTEVSLVDPALQINMRSPDYRGKYVGYHYQRNYFAMTPESRAAYLKWLASERTDPDCCIGYIFLYFYGIERRLIVQGKRISSSERAALVNEVWRLIRIFGGNHSFNRDAINLLAHVWVLYCHKEQPDELLLTGTREFTSAFKYFLGKTVADGKPVSSELALAWVRSHPDYSLRTPAKRCAKEFDLLFKLRYQEKFKPGIEIKPNKTRLKLHYRPSSPTLWCHPVTLDIPDPARLKRPVVKLMELATSCVDELNAYSRYIGNPANSVESLSVIPYLPDALLQLIQHAKFSNLKSWLRSRMNNSIGVVQTEDLSSRILGNSPVKINKKEAETLATLVEKAGFGLAPDIRFHHAKPEINGCVVLFENGHGSSFNPGEEFNYFRTILRLGAMVSTIDGHVDDLEVIFLEKLINDSCLTAIEKKSLHAYLRWRLQSGYVKSGQKSDLLQLNNREKAAISHILVGVALADGEIKSEEKKLLIKLYTQLGLDEATLSCDVNNLKLRKTKPSLYDHQAQTRSNNVSVTFSLDPDHLNECEKETEGVKELLDGIFAEDKIEDQSEHVANTVIVTQQVTGLDEAHTRLAEKLIHKEKWSSEEVKAICKELNLMVDGAIETVNDWAFDSVEERLIDDDGNMIHINLDVAQEIRTL